MDVPLLHDQPLLSKILKTLFPPKPCNNGYITQSRWMEMSKKC